MKPQSPEARLLDLRYRTEGPIPIEYELPADGYITLVIEDKKGRRVRNLIADYPRKAGENIDYWDGRDDRGDLVPVGTYQVRGLYHGELDVRYEFSYGSSGNPPWPTGDTRGAWLANHTHPIDVLADEERVYVAAPFSEGPHALIALDYEGRKIWGGLDWGYGGFMARVGDYLYVVNDQDARPARRREDLDEPAKIEIIRIDPKTGRKAPFPDGQSQRVIATWNIQHQGAARRHEGFTIAHHAHDADWAGIQAQGLAALGNTLYVSMHFSDKIIKVNAETGKVTGEVSVSAPAGLAANGDHLLAISGHRVVAVDPENGQVVPVIEEGLKAPIGLTLDSKGRIYVSDWADQMCVKVFSAKGKFLHTIGKVGGRSWTGPYDRQAMQLPRGISVDRLGRLWVAEDNPSPRRVSVWQSNGRLAFEKLGQPYYGASGTYIFPDQPDKALLLGNLIELDWSKGQWRVLGTPWRATHPNALFGLNYDAEISSVHNLNGRRLLVHSANGRFKGGVVALSEWRDGQAVPLAAIGPVYAAFPQVAHVWKTGFEPVSLFARRLWTDDRMNRAAHKLIPWFFKGPRAGDHRTPFLYRGTIQREAGIRDVHDNPDPNNNFVWSDLNGNGLVDEYEVHFYATPGLKGPLPPAWHVESWSHGVADDSLNLYLSAIQGGWAYHWQLPVSRWAVSGVPIYAPEEAKLIARSRCYLGEAAWLDRKGNLLTFGNIPNPSHENQRDPLVMYHSDGTIAWTYPSPYSGVHGSHTAPKARHGQLIGPLGVMGDASLNGVGQIFALHTNMGQAVLFTADGFYIGALFKDVRAAPQALPSEPRRGMSLNRISNGGEWFGGQFFQHPDTGEIYVVGGRTSADISRVIGLDTVRRLPVQRLEFTSAQYQQAAGKSSSDLSGGGEKKIPELVIMPLERRSDEKMLSVEAFDWRPQYAAQWGFDAQTAARATWRYDDKYLYLCFRVLDPTPLINQGEDPERLFKSGDAVLFELRTQANEDSAKVLLGDLRLLFSIFQGKPIAVLYRYHLPHAQDPVVLESVARTQIDAITVLSNARVAVTRQSDRYTLRAAVPLANLGFHPKPGKKYRGDFGIIYSDQAGIHNVLRMHWANKATGLVNDLALEARIEPQHWGQFELVSDDK